MFLERLGVFDYQGNKYYQPNGIFNTSNANSSIAMPNCTTYCFLRMHEASEQTKRQSNWIRKSGGFNNAKYWYSDDGILTRSNEPKDCSIAVFNGTAGHVAYIERVIKKNGNGWDCVISESNYDDNKSRRDWKFFRSRQVYLEVGKATLSGVGALIGFILVPTNDKRVSRDTSKYQVEITETHVNVRKTPNGELVSKGCYCPMGVYDVITVEVLDGYLWYQLDEECWIREGSWLKVCEEFTQLDYKAMYEEAMAKLRKIMEIIE